MLPKIGLTLGDPCGIGPEIVVKLLAEKEILQAGQPILLGDYRVFQMGQQAAGVSLDIPVLSSEEAVAAIEGLGAPAGEECKPAFIDFPSIDPAEITPGQVNAAAGQSVLETLTWALTLAQNHHIDALCFAPLNKQAMHLAGNPFQDELHFFADRLGATDPFRELNLLDALWTSRVTSHIPLKAVSEQITEGAVEEAIGLVYHTLRSAGLPSPRIAVAALNPHAGEGGLFGREEIDIIRPAVLQAQAHDIDVDGPFPSDTVFLKARAGEVDAVVTMYHDQGQIAMKLMGFERGVTVHGGLPIPITTPAHGTAFDIVGQGIARVGALRRAFLVACEMAQRRTGS